MTLHFTAILLAAATLLLPLPIRAADHRSATSNVEVCFSPHGGCTAAVVKELANAKTSVLVQAYSFTSAPIAQALVEARQRGVKVQVILDRIR